MIACGDDGPPEQDAAVHPNDGGPSDTFGACTGEAYDPCSGTGDCMQGLSCVQFHGLPSSYCSPACGGTTPQCPPDENGNTATCTGTTGSCLPTVLNDCA